jgi:gamma-butyrobetaine dioxygenase
LCAVNADYINALSPASKLSLELQGGPMSRQEADAFERSPHAAEACRLRRWDDAAKRTDAPVGDIDRYRPLVEAFVR